MDDVTDSTDAERIRYLLLRASDDFGPLEPDPAGAVRRRGRRRRGRVIVSCSLVLVLTAAVVVPLSLRALSPPPQSSAANAKPPPLLRRELWNISQRVAASSGDPDAYEREAVGPISRVLANEITSGDVVYSSTPSYVIEMRGRFTCGLCSSPGSGSPIKGSVITDVLNASTLQISDFGFADVWVPLTKLGAPFALPRPPHGTLWPLPSHIASRPPHLRANGIGAVHFGLSKVKTVAALQASLGKPNATFVNTGCGFRYSEVAWHDLIAEFRLGSFSGYRFATGGSAGWSPYDRVSPKLLLPRLTTARGITLGSTLRALRAAYPGLTRSGALKWKAPNGLIFVEGPLTKNPLSPEARIVEIKIGTCGTY